MGHDFTNRRTLADKRALVAYNSPMQRVEACDYPAWHPPVDVRLVTTPEHPCAYLPDRMARTRAFLADRMPAELYRQFMDAGFRRSGRVVYQPVCSGCRRCLPLRLPVDAFAPSKTQRRIWRRNQDLRITQITPRPSAEKFALYTRYQRDWHDGAMLGDWDDFVQFLYDAPVPGVELEYRTADDRLIGVGVCDISASSLSSVYFYFDPAESMRSLGTFGVLCEIDLARRLGISHYYLGYWVAGCRQMEYKASFWPHEVLEPDGVWRPADWENRKNSATSTHLTLDGKNSCDSKT